MSDFLDGGDGGDYLPNIIWSAKAVQWTKKGESGQEAFQPTTAIFDLEDIYLGWMYIAPGTVDKKLAHYEQDAPPRPEGTITDDFGKEKPKYQKAFSVHVLFGKEFGEERLFEFSASQKGACMAMSDLLKQYLAAKDANAGKVPVVTFGPHTNMTIGKGSTNIPGLSITSWVDRPQELVPRYTGSAQTGDNSSAPTPEAQPAQVANQF